MNPVWSFLKFQDLLKAVYEERNNKNPAYSSRAFARDVELDPGRVSKIFAGKQGMSRKQSLKLARILGFSSEEIDVFADLVDSEHARTEIRRNLARQRLEAVRVSKSYHKIRLDIFSIIENWFHFAILELTFCRGFKSEIPWIAKRLNISIEQASDAIERLIRLGFLIKSSKGFKRSNDHVQVGNEVPSQSIRTFHQQVLRKAIESLDSQSVDERYSRSIMIAADPSDVEKAKEIIGKLARELSGTLEKSSHRSDVYCFTVQFFNLSHS